MTGAVGKLDDLRFQRRAMPRASAVDKTVVVGAFFQVLADDAMCRFVGV